MKYLPAAITAAMLFMGANGVRAAEPIPPSLPPAEASPAQAGPAGPSCGASGCHAGCASCNAGCGKHGATLMDWLSYAPLHRARCGECNTCCHGCLPPLYLYFLGACQERDCATCGCANGCGGGCGH